MPQPLEPPPGDVAELELTDVLDPCPRLGALLEDFEGSVHTRDGHIRHGRAVELVVVAHHREEDIPLMVGELREREEVAICGWLGDVVDLDGEVEVVFIDRRGRRDESVKLGLAFEAVVSWRGPFEPEPDPGRVEDAEVCDLRRWDVVDFDGVMEVV